MVEIKQTGRCPDGQQGIFIVDDDFGVRESLEIMLEPFGCRCYAFESGERFRDSLMGDKLHYGCAIVDLRLKGMSGLSVLKLLKENHPCIVPLLVTAFADIKLCVDAFAMGAATVISKPSRDQDLWDAVSVGLAASQERFAEQQRKIEMQERLGRLSSGEQHVLWMLVKGESNKQIATACDISLRTVDLRRSAILKKIVCNSVVELTWMIAQSGIDFNQYIDV